MQQQHWPKEFPITEAALLAVPPFTAHTVLLMGTKKCFWNTNCRGWFLCFLKVILPVIFNLWNPGQVAHRTLCYGICRWKCFAERAGLDLQVSRPLYLLSRQLRVGSPKMVPAGIAMLIAVMQAAVTVPGAAGTQTPGAVVLAVRHSPPRIRSTSPLPKPDPSELHHFLAPVSIKPNTAPPPHPRTYSKYCKSNFYACNASAPFYSTYIFQSCHLIQL